MASGQQGAVDVFKTEQATAHLRVCIYGQKRPHLFRHRGVHRQGGSVLNKPYAHGPRSPQLLLCCLEGMTLQLKVPFRGEFKSSAGQVELPTWAGKKRGDDLHEVC